MPKPISVIICSFYFFILLHVVFCEQNCDFSKQPENATIHCQCVTYQADYIYLSCNVRNASVTVDDTVWSEIMMGRGQFHGTNLFDETGKLSFIPWKMLTGQNQMDTVEIKNANLSQIPAWSFHNITELQRIFLSGNQIADIAKSAFVDLPILFILVLSWNKIRGIQKDSFAALPILETIDLSHNDIATIESGAFSNLSQLIGLNLEYNKFTKIDEAFWLGLENIKYIDLHNNQIESLANDSLGNVTSLEYLNLSQNRIKNISTKAFSGLAELRFLGLGDNLLEAIEEDLFVGLTRLTYLKLDSNNIKIFSNAAAGTIKANLLHPARAWEIDPFVDFSALGNNLVCNCDIKWMYELSVNSINYFVRDSLSNVDCTAENGTIFVINRFPDFNLNCTTNDGVI